MFHKLDKNDYEKEMERHDRAMERLSAEKEKWYERTVEKKNKIALLRQKLQDANKDLDHEAREPKLQDYYEPSNKMKRYMDIVTGVIESVSGFLITKFFI